MIRFDCHAHVFETLAAVPGARYTPVAPAPLERWSKHLQQHELLGGVIVQVSFLGTDNSELCGVLGGLDRTRFAGVAVVAPDIAEHELERLASAGVAGIRWNLVSGQALPDLNAPDVRDFLARLRAHGLHLELHLESSRLAAFIGPLLRHRVVVVVDHLGLPSDPDPAHDPWLQAVRALPDLSGLYVKCSGAYRIPFDTTAHVSALQVLLPPERFVWGSDWPHTRHEQVASFDQVARQRDRYPASHECDAVRALYGLSWNAGATER